LETVASDVVDEIGPLDFDILNGNYQSCTEQQSCTNRSQKLCTGYHLLYGSLHRDPYLRHDGLGGVAMVDFDKLVISERVVLTNGRQNAPGK